MYCSIIVPVYNGANFLGECLKALKAASGVEAVDQEAAGEVLVSRKAADGVGIPEPAEVILPGDTAHQIQGVVEPRDADIPQQIGR